MVRDVNLQNVCRFFKTKSAKETQFDDLAFAWIDISKRLERLIQSKHISRAPVSRNP